MIHQQYFVIVLCLVVFVKTDLNVLRGQLKLAGQKDDSGHVSSSTTTMSTITNSTVTSKDQNVTSTSIPEFSTTDASSRSHQAVADAAIAVITVIALSIILSMSIYFVRKFEQLNRSTPSYRYSSLKTEINGINGMDDKIESQALVSASTEEEDDFDEEEMSSPPTLFIQSQTTMATSKSDSGLSVAYNQIPKSMPKSAKQMKDAISIDSDDELLQ